MNTDQKFWFEQIDRLVDGELSENQRRELLLACEEDPLRWRDIALTFVESQIWSTEFPEAISNSVSPNSEIRPRTSSTRRAHLMNGWWNLSIAAALMLCLGFGIGNFSKYFSTDSTTFAKDGKTTDSAVAGLNSNNSRIDDSILMMVRDHQTGGMKPVSLPLVDSSSMARSLPEFESIDWVRQLRELGHNVQQTRRYHRVQLPDGRTMVLPVDDVHVNISGYQ